MAIIHKLSPEIKNCIIEKKRANPTLSCRRLVFLLKEELKIKVAKSSINCLFKEAGLSMPVGRRQKKRRPPIETAPKLLAPPVEKLAETPPKMPEAPKETPPQVQKEIPPQVQKETPPSIPIEIQEKMLSSGIILLRAADYLIGGSYHISEAIKRRLRLQDNELLAKIECLIYAPLLGMPEESLKIYLNEMRGIETIVPDILQILSGILTEVRCIKVLLSSGDALYLDGQLHTIWSVPNIPYAFVNTIGNIKNYLNKFFYQNAPLVLFMAPGYDTPTLELFNFLLSFGDQGKKIASATVCSNKLVELESIPLEQNKKHSLVLGLWPWQFVAYRRVKKMGEFKPFYFAARKREFYLADIEIELSNSAKNQTITFFGCALKTKPAEKTRLIILSNLSQESAKPEELANIYLNQWPNLEEAFGDFSRKVELFTYTADSQRFFSPENIDLSQGIGDIKQLLECYLKALDLYVRWQFLPTGYENKDLSTIKEEFYDLKVISQPEKEHTLVTFQPPEGFPSIKALEYACCRLNERAIILNESSRLWFSL